MTRFVAALFRSLRRTNTTLPLHRANRRRLRTIATINNIVTLLLHLVPHIQRLQCVHENLLLLLFEQEMRAHIERRIRVVFVGIVRVKVVVVILVVVMVKVVMIGVDLRQCSQCG
jgi:hypothetical protein